MSPDAVCLDNQIKSLVDDKKWEDIITIGKQLTHDEKSRYIWVWPDKCSLYFIKNCLESLQINMILSIGCGSGLLEWLIMESTGIHVTGIEIDEKWWLSKYSPAKFIELNYVDNKQINVEFLENCAKNECFLLLFCYFNCHEAFRKYLQVYKGQYLMIIGPDIKHKKQNIFTEPLPFDLGLNPIENVWQLYKFHKLDCSGNFVTIYKRNEIT